MISIQPKSIILYLVFLLLSGLCIAQSPELQNVISSTSPGTASLGKYIDMPVTLSNGLPEISIPACDLKSSKLSISVNFSYHAGGIKVSERTSTMGLGWSVNAGGAVTRVVRGLPDDSPNGFLNMNWPTGSGGNPSLNDQYCLFNHLYNSYSINGSETLWDGEPDCFYYNAGSIGGKFIFRNTADANGQRAVTLPYAPVKIDYLPGNTVPFAITDLDGTIYQFGQTDQTFGASTDYYNDQSAPSAVRTVNTAWYLTRIISPDQSDTISFAYNSTQDLFPYSFPTISMVAHASINENLQNTGGSCQITTGSSSRQEFSARLKQISCKTGKIVFNYSDIDLNNQNVHEYPLSTVDLYSLSNGTYQKLKTISLYNSSFQTTGQNLNILKLDSVAITGYLNGQTIAQPPYKLSYSTADVPPYNSTSQDLWGFYNGYVNYTGNSYNSNLLLANSVNGKVEYAPEKRTANPLYMGKAMLTKLQYPTGGATQFDFEPNQITSPVQVTTKQQPTVHSIGTSQMSASNPTNGVKITFAANQGGSGTATLTFSGTSVCAVGASNPNCVENDPRVVLEDVTSGATLIDKLLDSLKNGSVLQQNYSQVIANFDKTHSYRLYFKTPGTITSNTQNTHYKLDANLSEDMPDLVSSQVKTVYAGGLRIKKISSDDGSGKKLTKIYRYTKTYFTSNVFQGTFDYLFNNSLIQTKKLPGNGGALYVSSKYYLESPSFPLGGAFNSSIAYEEVEEVDTSDNGSNGKTVYTFNKAMDNILNWPTTFKADRDYIRKQLLSVKTYKNGISESDPVLIKKVENAYNNLNENALDAAGQDSIKFYIANSDYDFRYRIQQGGSVAPADASQQAPGCTEYAIGSPYQLIPYFYHINRPLLMSTRTVDYAPEQNDSLVQITKYTYDNLAHIQPTQTEASASDGEILLQTSKFPLDYGSLSTATTEGAAIVNLRSRHVVNAAIEKSRYSKNADGSGQKLLGSVYTTFDASIPAPKLISAIETSAPISDFIPSSSQNNALQKDSRYKPQISITYDAQGYLIQQQKVNNLPVSYIWDYDKTYPVAEIKNAEYNEVAYTSFEANGKGSWTFNSSAISASSGSVTGKSSYALSGNPIARPSLPSGDYTVTYWIKNSSGNITVNGTTGTAVITKNNWTLYSNKLSSITSITLSGTAIIDEVRLCPSDAQITTYTYEPLVGITGQCDVNNRIVYYEYDGLGRLARARDMDKNILKQYSYKYQGQSGSADVPLCVSTSSSYSNATTTLYNVTMTNTATSATFAFSIPKGTNGITPGTYDPATGTVTGIPSGIYNIKIAPSKTSDPAATFGVNSYYYTGNTCSVFNVRVVCPDTLSIMISDPNGGGSGF